MAEEKAEIKSRNLEWMLHPCHYYSAEHSDCKAWRSRFYQYFVHGELSDCSQWRVDYDNCKAWKRNDEDAAYEALVTSEQERRLRRLGPHFRNDVWTKRDEPPKNWNSPLPEWMEKRFEASWLNYKQKGLESGNVNDLDVKLPLCTIS